LNVEELVKKRIEKISKEITENLSQLKYPLFFRHKRGKHYFICNYCGNKLVLENGNPCYIGYSVEFRRSLLGNIIGLTVTARSYCKHCVEIIKKVSKKVIWEEITEYKEVEKNE